MHRCRDPLQSYYRYLFTLVEITKLFHAFLTEISFLFAVNFLGNITCLATLCFLHGLKQDSPFLYVRYLIIFILIYKERGAHFLIQKFSVNYILNFAIVQVWKGAGSTLCSALISTAYSSYFPKRQVMKLQA